MGGAAVGAGVGFAFAAVELAVQSWQTRFPPMIGFGILVADVAALTIAGVLIDRIPRLAPRRGPLLLGIVAALASFPHVAGIALNFGKDSGLRYGFAIPRWACLAAAVGAAITVASLWTPAAVAALRGRGRTLPGWQWALVTALTAATMFAAAAIDQADAASWSEIEGIVTYAAIVAVGLLAIRIVHLAPARPGFAVAALAAVMVSMGITSGWIVIPRAAVPSPADTTRPNVFLIVLDTVRADHLSVYGYGRPTTPTLERLAAESVTYERAISPATWTVPAHASILTGLLPSEHGTECVTAPDGSRRLQPMGKRVTTLAEALGSRGYTTGAFLANGLTLSPLFGFGRGFDRFYVPKRASFFVRPSLGALVSAAYPDDYARFIRPFRSATRMSEVALSWLDAQGARPKFVLLNFMEAHYPYEVRPPYAEQFSGIQPIREDFRDPWTWYRQLSDAVDNGTPVDAIARRHLEASYDAAIAALDSALDTLFTALRERGLWDDALVIVTSDHGELFGEHGLIQHMVEPFEGVVHVPLLVKYPHARRVARESGLISTREVFRIVLGEADHRPPPDASDAVITEFYPGPRRKTVRPERIRYAAYRGDEKVVWSSDGDHAVYRLSTDPLETQNLYRIAPDAAVSPLLAALEARHATTLVGRGEAETDESVIERLQAMGYVQ